MSAWYKDVELRHIQKRLRYLAGERTTSPSGNGISASKGRAINEEVDRLVRQAAARYLASNG